MIMSVKVGQKAPDTAFMMKRVVSTSEAVF